MTFGTSQRKRVATLCTWGSQISTLRTSPQYAGPAFASESARTIWMSSRDGYLARIDPTTWKATPIGTGTGYDNIFGLGFWDGKIYGFVSSGTDSGKIITIDKDTGVGTQVQSGAVRWYGAGVATNAPVIQ